MGDSSRHFQTQGNIFREGSDDGNMTLKDLDQQLLAHVVASTPPAHTIFNNQYKYVPNVVA